MTQFKNVIRGLREGRSYTRTEGAVLQVLQPSGRGLNVDHITKTITEAGVSSLKATIELGALHQVPWPMEGWKLNRSKKPR